MNREILFKAKRKDNGEWATGNILQSDEDTYIATSFLAGNADEPLMVAAYEIVPETLCQCTGLTDKNGKKIWEHDILHRAYHAEEDCIVQWHDGSYRFKTIHGSYRQDPMTFLSLCFTEKMVCNLKVIGNIFDNVDLLEVE